MRIDLYTKTILTLIALLLAVIAIRPLVQPVPASAQSSLSGVQFTGGMGGFWAIDTRSGDVWAYDFNGGQNKVDKLGKITQLGKPLAK